MSKLDSWRPASKKSIINLREEMMERMDVLTAQLRDVTQYARELQSCLGALSGMQAASARESSRAPEQPLRLGFLIHNIEAFGGLEPVIREALNDSRFEPFVFSVPRCYARGAYRDEEMISEELTKRGIPHLRLRDKDSYKDLSRLSVFRLDAVFRQSHWEEDLPPGFRSENLRCFGKIYYLPYELSTMIQGAEHPDYLELLSEKVFMASPAICRAYQQRFSGWPIHFCCTGHPKVQSLLSAEPYWPISGGNSVRILWSAHHSISDDWNNFGVFPRVYRRMLQIAREHPTWDFLFSPHPALLQQFDSMPEWHGEEVQDFLKTWESLPNCAIIRRGEYMGAAKASDILVADGLSLLAEYQFNLKPVIYLSRPDSTPFNAFGKQVILGVTELPAERIAELPEYVETNLHQPDEKKHAAQQALIEELTQPGNAARNILDEILKDFGFVSAFPGV